MDYRWSAKPLMTWIGTNMPVATSLGANTSYAMKQYCGILPRRVPCRVYDPFSGAVPMHYVTTVLCSCNTKTSCWFVQQLMHSYFVIDINTNT